MGKRGKKPAPVEERFWSHVEFPEDPDGCWIWTAGRKFNIGGHYAIPRRPARLAYEWTVGPVPEGYWVKRTCAEPRCVNPDHRTLFEWHPRRPPAPRLSREQRFWAKVDRSGGPDACWPWMGAFRGDGRGQVTYNSRVRKAHHVAWELSGGSAERGLLHLHHTCENPPCVNPAHLRLATQAEHADLHRPKFCKYGHEFSEENTYTTSTGGRQCRTCNRRRDRERYLRRRELTQTSMH